MILDSLDNASRYRDLHPAFGRAFDYLLRTDLSAAATGRHDIDGDRMFVLVQEHEGTGPDTTKLEAHKAYIDIQLTISGQEEIGWMPAARCRQPEDEFDAARDIIFYRDRPMTSLVVPPRQFAVFFPEDAHAPLGGRGAVKKAVLKVAVR
jgi:YhcH/YjgK/YiaL family protein